MRIQDNPKLVLGLLVAIFLLAFALSVLTLGYTGGHTVFLQGDQPTSGYHFVYFHFVNGGTNVTSTNYPPQSYTYHN